jgi:acyl carrier protein
MTKICKKSFFEIINRTLKLDLPAEDLENSRLNQLKIDSLDLVSLDLKFQENFNVEINSEILTPDSTLGDLVNQLISSAEKKQSI